MVIHVFGEDTISPQARTYAEYRVFAALTQFGGRDNVRQARVLLRSSPPERGGESVTCTVTVDLEGRRPMRVRVRGDHAYAAINRAVERLRAGNALTRLADSQGIA